LSQFKKNRPDLAGCSYREQKEGFSHDMCTGADAWRHALTPLGYEVLEIVANATSIQLAWARANDFSTKNIDSLHAIAVEQAVRFNPDVLWFNNWDVALLKRVRDYLPSLKLVMGWVGSAVPATEIWHYMDLVLTCAPESLGYLRERGLCAEHLDHAFDSRIMTSIIPRPANINLSFAGHIVRDEDYHGDREELLLKLARCTGMEIFSPSAAFGWQAEFKWRMMVAGYLSVKGLRKIGFSDTLLSNLPLLKIASEWPSKPLSPINRKLKPYLKPAVFGLDMYQVLHDSKVTLNIHADSSSRFASNMRLFEATGAGTCLLTDARPNMHELFETDKEVVTYSSHEECMEKVIWLMDNPEQREQIAKAGRARVLKQHTFELRAQRLNQIIRKFYCLNV
jgi:hypothetical protein